MRIKKVIVANKLPVLLNVQNLFIGWSGKCSAYTDLLISMPSGDLVSQAGAKLGRKFQFRLLLYSSPVHLIVNGEMIQRNTASAFEGRL